MRGGESGIRKEEGNAQYSIFNDQRSMLKEHGTRNVEGSKEN